MKKVAVVTVNYNTDEDTKALLRSLEHVKKNDFEIEIIVVDNGSKIALLLPYKEKKENVTSIRSDVNTGFAGGYNIGIRKAIENGADFVLIVNNDTLTDSEMIVNLLEVLGSDPK